MRLTDHTGYDVHQEIKGRKTENVIGVTEPLTENPTI